MRVAFFRFDAVLDNRGRLPDILYEVESEAHKKPQTAIAITMVTEQKTPFDWLHGGLFFGKPSKDGIGVIDSCKDPISLLNGLKDNLSRILENSSKDAMTPATDVATSEKKDPSPSDFLAARLARLRYLLYSERQKTSAESSSKRHVVTPTVAFNTSKEVTRDAMQELVPQLLKNLSILPFESRKHVAAIFNYLLVCGLDGEDGSIYTATMQTFRDFIKMRFDRFLTIIVEGHKSTDSVLHYGSMFRSCLRHPSLYEQLVASRDRTQRYIYPFLDSFVQNPNFEISSDAMESVRAFMGANNPPPEIAPLSAAFLKRDYEPILMERFNGKLLAGSAGYMNNRVALQILSSVLLMRSNYSIMIQYVATRENLILVMKLLRDTSPHITLDAFHVFKVFVANPNKPDDVTKILRDNKVKLCAYLKTLHVEKEDADTQFRDEKVLIISTIEAL